MFQGKRDQLLNTGDRLSKIKTELCLLDSATSRSLESLRQVVLVEVKVSIFGTGGEKLGIEGLDKSLEKQDDR